MDLFLAQLLGYLIEPNNIKGPCFILFLFFNIPQFDFCCTLFHRFNFFFFFLKFHFSLLNLSRLVTKEKEEGIVNT